MKKIGLLAAALMVSAGMFAQNLWIGGSIGFESNKVKNADAETSWVIAPNVGYKFSEKMSGDLSLFVGGTGDFTTYGATVQGLYWISLGEKFSYTPGVYVTYQSVKPKDGDAQGAFGLGLKLVKFEYQISDKVSLGFEAGEFGAAFPKDETNINLSLNANPALSFRYWF